MTSITDSPVIVFAGIKRERDIDSAVVPAITVPLVALNAITDGFEPNINGAPLTLY
jgi:hypothetical protein